VLVSREELDGGGGGGGGRTGREHGRSSASGWPGTGAATR
jgi:hypothetical protein